VALKKKKKPSLVLVLVAIAIGRGFGGSGERKNKRVNVERVSGKKRDSISQKGPFQRQLPKGGK